MEAKEKVYTFNFTEKEINIIVNSIATANNIRWTESNPLINHITKSYQQQKNTLEKENNGDNISDSSGIDK